MHDGREKKQDNDVRMTGQHPDRFAAVIHMDNGVIFSQCVPARPQMYAKRDRKSEMKGWSRTNARHAIRKTIT